nr:GvpL/GvpF family gas vesicle protein [Labedaea rhizosphaerae]
MAADTGVWLYAVTAGVEKVALGDLTGVAGVPPRSVADGELTAVVGDVPLSKFGEEALHRNFEDFDWLAEVARAHDGVIAALSAAGPVVPIRLATVYTDDDGVRLVLRERAAEFTRALEHVTGRTEWGVKVFLVAKAEPDPGEQSSGKAYLMRRKAALANREDGMRRAVGQANAVHAALSELATDARTHPPQSQALAGDDAQMVLNAAYLVDDGDTQRFADAVAACDDDNDAIRLELTGPWSPYSFSSVEET